MSTITKDLGAVTAYAYAVEQGYTGTEEEFAELMADYAAVEQRAAQSATAAQTSATNASQSASASAQSASQASASATAAGQSASTASTKADEASTSAQTAGAKATEASGYASTASTKASEASQSASAASGYATAAGQAKTAAESAQTAAEGSAQTALTAAQTAATKAAEAAESARTLTIDPTLTQSGQAADAKVTGDWFENRDSLLHIEKKTVSESVTTVIETPWTSGYIARTGTKTAPHANYSYSDIISVEYGDVFTVENNYKMRYVCAYDSNDQAIYDSGAELADSYTVPSGITHIVISLSNTVIAQNDKILRTRLEAVDKYQLTAQAYPHVFFVSRTGDDDNDGLTPLTPKATVNNALDSGAETVLMLGGVYTQTIDLSKAQYGKITIAPYEKTKRVVFEYDNAVLSTTETKVDGYENVYSFPCNLAYNAKYYWFFQDGVADAKTIINPTERHPLQRGYTNRCEDTRIVRVDNHAYITLEDALTSIDTSDDYRWYLDTENHILYYSRPQTVDVEHPICYSGGTNLFSGNSRKVSIVMIGIDCKYQIVNLNNLHSAVLENCRVANVFGVGCITYAGVASGKFIHCEASRAFNGTNGDGFNAHGVTTGDYDAHQTYAEFVDCWSHDNMDDGCSDHERCETSIVGGLFEYNRYGGGVTPAFGSHCTCNGVYCRKNGDGGFLYMDSASAAEGGAGGQLICYSCVAEENTLWPEHTPTGFKINGHGNHAILINCKSVGQDNAFYLTENDSYITLIDCGSLNCQTIKGGVSANYTIKNTSLVV